LEVTIWWFTAASTFLLITGKYRSHPPGSGREIIRMADYSDAEHWDLYRLANENDPTGGTIVRADDTLTVKDGDRFRVIEGHHTMK
jgi:hypothetical protein